jgi:hypothetical protein
MKKYSCAKIDRGLKIEGDFDIANIWNRALVYAQVINE